VSKGVNTLSFRALQRDHEGCPDTRDTWHLYPAENAGEAAYADAGSEYAALEWDELLPPTSGRG
jgi:hypothetical protein